MEKAIIDALIVGGPALVTGWIGFYLGAYLKKKGENQAIHEDINKLVDQVRAVTQTTKEIEAKISSDMWTRQKQWEMKRDVLFEAAKRIIELDNGLLTLDSLLHMDDPEGDQWLKAKHQALIGWNDTIKKFEETQLLIGVICSKETSRVLYDVALFIKELAGRLVKKELGAYNQSSGMLAKALMAARIAIRKELGIEEATTLQASASSS